MFLALRICHMCGDQAVFECPECYENETTELSAAAFCEPCSQTVSDAYYSVTVTVNRGIIWDCIYRQFVKGNSVS